MTVLDKLLRDLLILTATIDPIGTLSIFVGLTSSMDRKTRRQMALRATLIAAGVLVAFIALGQLVLSGMGVSIEAFQIAGSVILFLFGLQMIFGQTERMTAQTPEEGHSMAVFPLALPSIASPGAILAAVLLTDNHLYSIGTQAMTAGVLLFVLAVTLTMMLLATPIHRVIGDTGAKIGIRIMGILLTALAVEMMLDVVVPLFFEMSVIAP